MTAATGFVESGRTAISSGAIAITRRTSERGQRELNWTTTYEVGESNLRHSGFPVERQLFLSDKVLDKVATVRTRRGLQRRGLFAVSEAERLNLDAFLTRHCLCLGRCDLQVVRSALHVVSLWIALSTFPALGTFLWNSKNDKRSVVGLLERSDPSQLRSSDFEPQVQLKSWLFLFSKGRSRTQKLACDTGSRVLSTLY